MPNECSPQYAVLDLGSNSFHMLVVREVQGSIQTLAKIKRKVRLAAGLDRYFNLSEEAMERGWDCLALFAQRLQGIPPSHVRIVATAALRNAKNADFFLAKAHQILGYPVCVISGKKEAHTIFQGVAHTSGGVGKCLVVDIGGASTEIIIGEGFEAQVLSSLHMGCVTWLDHHFKDELLNEANFHRAIQGAKQVLSHVVGRFCKIGWNGCVGASGTVQALQKVMLAQGMGEVITLERLYEILDQVIRCGQFERLEIDGLALERKLVFPSGLSILIAIFETFCINSMTLAGGALREGLMYGMINTIQDQDIRKRTIKSIQSRFCLDTEQGDNVANTALSLLNQCDKSWIPEPIAKNMLDAAARLCEIGLSVGFEKNAEHSAYLINHLELPGFTPTQKRLLGELFLFYRDKFHVIEGKNVMSASSANRVLRLFRLAIILCHQRCKNAIPSVLLETNEDAIVLTLPKGWIDKYPLMAAELAFEAQFQNDNHGVFTFS